MRTRGVPWAAEFGVLAAFLAAIGLLTTLFVIWLRVNNPTTVALSFLLVVLIAATVATRRVAIAASLMAFLCFNYFFLPPVGTWSIADPDNWVALFTLLAVSVVASHLSSQVRSRAQEAAAQRDELARLLEERKAAEAIRREAELKSALLDSLGHDFKTPLTALTVAANNLDKAWLTDDQRREQAEIVRTELARLNRMFEDIVDMARIDAHAVNAEPEWVQPGEIVEAAARQVEHDLAAHPLEVDAEADRMLVRVDPRLTSAALAHLLENAAQYSPPGSTITVTTTVPDRELQIAVRDRGTGMVPTDRDRVFERFYRGWDARQRRAGSGMGLAITRGLLAAEGGRVWGENHPEGGAVFTMAVPAESRTADGLEGESM